MMEWAFLWASSKTATLLKNPKALSKIAMVLDVIVFSISPSRSTHPLTLNHDVFIFTDPSLQVQVNLLLALTNSPSPLKCGPLCRLYSYTHFSVSLESRVSSTLLCGAGRYFPYSLSKTFPSINIPN